MILLIDNYDSFVHNLARCFRRLGQTTHVVRNDAITVEQAAALAPQAIVLSPGPCTPHEAGCSLDMARQLGGRIPLLGVCLGHQCIAAALGAAIVRAETPMHGKTSQICHQGQGVFAGLPNPLNVGRYHSLVIDRSTLGDQLEVWAETDDGVIMAVARRTEAKATTTASVSESDAPMIGIQFHPESILTECGYPLLANFLRLAGVSGVMDPQTLSPEYAPPPPSRQSAYALHVPIAYDWVK